MFLKQLAKITTVTFFFFLNITVYLNDFFLTIYITCNLYLVDMGFMKPCLLYFCLSFFYILIFFLSSHINFEQLY